VQSGTAKFREETSKKADSAITDRIAATHKIGQHDCTCKVYFVLQSRFAVDTFATAR